MDFSHTNFDKLWKHVAGQWRMSPDSVHGPDHWRRVERNGLLLARRTGANLDVVRLFALFHDSRRENEDRDEGHGKRGAMFAASLRGVFFEVTDEAFKLLQYACTWHTEGHHHQNPTIGTCWDADRLDLGRVGAKPNASFMSTDFGRKIAASGSLQPFLSAGAAALCACNLLLQV
jgi:uncharacterized protein